MAEEEEIVFEIGGEGGGICIYRLRTKSSEKFIYHHNEFDATDEGNDVNFKDEYSSFEQPFQVIKNSYEWYRLSLMTVHEDYRQYIIEELIRSLNDKSVIPRHLEFTRRTFENTLRIRLKYSANKDPKKINWSYSMDNNRKETVYCT